MIKRLNPWLWRMVVTGVTGFAHGAVVGTGVVATRTNAHEMLDLGHAAALGGIVGAGKDILLYVNTNPLPDIFTHANNEPNK